MTEQAHPQYGNSTARGPAPGRKRGRTGKRLLGVLRNRAKVLEHGMFPTALLPRPNSVYRCWTMRGLMRAMEHALLSRKWKRAGLLAIGAFKYMFLEPQTIIKSISGEDRLTIYNAGIAMILEVFLHLPGADTNATCLLDSWSRITEFPFKLRRRVACGLLRMFFLACKGHYEHAAEALHVKFKSRISLKRRVQRDAANASFARGILYYGMWLKTLQENNSCRIGPYDNADQVPIHFEAVDWAKANTQCSQLGHNLKINLERALREIPAVDGFFKLSHYYSVMGNWDAALETSARCRRLFPLDADAHTLFYCISVATEKKDDNYQEPRTILSACESLVSVLQCDPMSVQAVTQLVKTGRNLQQDNDCNNTKAQVFVVEGLLYRLDMFPLVSRIGYRPQATPGQENYLYDYQSWENLAFTLISFTCCLRNKERRRKESSLVSAWNEIEILLKNRYNWWKRWMFSRSNLVLERFRLKDEDTAKFLATVCICSDYIAGAGNVFGKELLEALERASWHAEARWVRKARSILTKVRAWNAQNS